MEITSEDIDMSVKGLELEMPFIEADEREKLLALRELDGLDKQLKTLKGALKVVTAKSIDLKGRKKES